MFALTTDYHVMVLVVGGVQRQGSVHDCGWYTADMSGCCPLRDAVLSLRQYHVTCLLLGDQHKGYLFTYECVFTE
jgi:hypothetical protein